MMFYTLEQTFARYPPTITFDPVRMINGKDAHQGTSAS